MQLLRQNYFSYGIAFTISLSLILCTVISIRGRPGKIIFQLIIDIYFLTIPLISIYHKNSHYIIRPGFELGLLSPFPTRTTMTPGVPLPNFTYIYITSIPLFKYKNVKIYFLPMRMQVYVDA